jgi:G3E family GTPase
VVDAETFLALVAEATALSDLGLAVNEQDARTMGTLLVDQVEFADVVIVNKADRATPAHLEQVKASIHALNPGARVLASTRGVVPLHEVLGTGRFDMEAAQERPAWIAELRGHHTPETEAYGVGSFVFRARRPFHPGRLQAWLASPWPGVLRAKGWFWVASRPNHCATFQLAGGTRETSLEGSWWAAVRPEKRPTDQEFQARMEKVWDPTFGDRRQEIVVIGAGMDVEGLKRGFELCLLDDRELRRPERWPSLAHPFPWG